MSDQATRQAQAAAAAAAFEAQRAAAAAASEGSGRHLTSYAEPLEEGHMESERSATPITAPVNPRRPRNEDKVRNKYIPNKEN